GAIGHRSATGAAVVKRGQPVAVTEAVELKQPGLDGVPEATDQQHVRSRANLLCPDIQITHLYVVADVVCLDYGHINCSCCMLGAYTAGPANALTVGGDPGCRGTGCRDPTVL